MSKIRRGGHSAEGETLSAGRVEYLEAARARVLPLENQLVLKPFRILS